MRLKSMITSALVAAGVLAAGQAFAQEKLTVWWGKGYYKSEDDALYAAIKKFEAKHPKIKVDLSLYAPPGRAIVRDPKVFLFDEPLSNLDAKLRVAMRAEIKALHQRLKTTTVYVTHDQIEAMTMADRIVVMHDGLIEQIGTPLALFDRPANLFVAQFIGSPGMNVVPGVLRLGGGAAHVEALGCQWPATLGGRDGQAEHYGIRPTDIALSTSGPGIAAKVIVVEPTGAETELLLQIGSSEAGEAQFVVVTHGRTDVQPDDTVHLSIEARHAHVFDAASGQRVV